jgi:hypothetical protein
VTAWPTHDEELLLRAALLDGEEARDSWLRWRRIERSPALDPATTRLLPLVAHNLASSGLDDPLLARGRRAQSLVWGRNQALLRAAAPVIEGLEQQGIPVLLLKGAALASAYGSFALRPMNDVDLLVPTADAGRARAICTAAGFSASYWLPASCLPLVHAMGYRDAGGRELDLHWHALWECCQPDADADLWRRAVPLRVGGREVLGLAPSDQALHVVAHGLRWSAPPSVHWLADLVLVLRGPIGALRWEDLVAAAVAKGLVLQLRSVLVYARDRLQAPVPAPVLADLRRLPVRRGARLEMRLRQRPPGLVSGFLLHWFDHLRLGDHAEGWGALASFPQHLRRAWGLAILGQLPLAAVRKSKLRLLTRRRVGSAC